MLGLHNCFRYLNNLTLIHQTTERFKKEEMLGLKSFCKPKLSLIVYKAHYIAVSISNEKKKKKSKQTVFVILLLSCCAGLAARLFSK